jgi:hypothetical protein
MGRTGEWGERMAKSWCSGAGLEEVVPRNGEKISKDYLEAVLAEEVFIDFDKGNKFMRITVQKEVDRI